MGCGSSQIQPGKFPPKSIVVAHALVTDSALPIRKIKAFEAIKKNDSFLVERILESIEPVENLGLPGDNHTFFHVAAQHNSFQAMEVLLSWLNDYKKSEMESILSIQNSEGLTPLELCIMNDSSETFCVLINSKVVNYSFRNALGQNLLEMCRQYSFNCLVLLEKAENDGLFNMEDIQSDPNETMIKEQTEESPNLKNTLLKLKKSLQKAETIAKHVGKVKAQSKEQKFRRKALDHVALQGVPFDSKVYELITKFAEKEGHYVDPDFKASLQSITTEKEHPFFSHFQKAVWRRPNEFFKCNFSEIFLFDTVDPHDISQGILGVCYLLSALSALAEFPSRLTQIFINTTSNKFGVYGMKIHVKGIPIEIVIDDYIPCYGDNKNQPLFSKPKGKELWVLLAEKIWAKVYKTYVACEAGFMDEALEYLLGTPTTRHLTSELDLDEIWDILIMADKKKCVICAATNNEVTKDMGLIAGHAYSIISVHSLQNYRIIKLRNPWGKFEWNGDFADNSPLWTDELKKKVGYTNADDGLFCMTVQDFKKCFEFISICIYHEGWEYSYIEVESDPNHAEYFKFSVDEPCEIYLRIHQEDKRHLSKEEQEKFKYSSADLILARIEDDGTYCTQLDDQKMIHNGTFFGARSIYPSKKCKLDITEPGEYIIRTKVRWRNRQRNKFTLSAYCPTKIDLERIDPIKDFLCKLFKNMGQKSEKKDMGNNCSLVYSFYLHHLYIYLENKGTSKWVIDIKFTKLQNLKLGKAFKVNDNHFRLEIMPGETKVAIAKKIEVSAAASYGWEFEHQMINL